MADAKYLADYSSRPIEIVDGEGCYVFDKNGKRYIDFLAGWCVGNVGWKRREILEAIRKETERGIYVSPVLRFPDWEEFARMLVEISPNKRLSRVLRCTSGSEAVEFAIKCARAATGKKTIISIEGVYHGHTYGAASVGNACHESMEPCVPGFIKIPMPNDFRGISAEAVIEEFEQIAKSNQDIAAFLSEPVWTNAGSLVPPKEFYPAIEKICRQYGILLIMDEVATGFGRCGKLFASDLWNIKPDILCLGKGLTGGYGTMGAALITEEIFKRSFGIPAYSTFGWLPTDLAATRENVKIIIREKLWENAERMGKYLLENLKPLEEKSFVGEVRGMGLVLGIEIVKDKKSKNPDWRKAQVLQDRCAERGLLVETAWHTLFITPPLILTKEIADQGIEILKSVITEED